MTPKFWIFTIFSIMVKAGVLTVSNGHNDYGSSLRSLSTVLSTLAPNPQLEYLQCTRISKQHIYK